MAFVDYYKKSDLERLDRDAFREMPTAVDPFWTPSIYAMGGIGIVYMRNLMKGRPGSSALHYHVIASVLGYGIGLKLDDYFRQRSKRRWAIIRDYVELHPEDFPPYPPRIKFANVLQPWVPIRPGS